MSTVKKRRRGTAIVETPRGVLVVAGHSKVYLLPGGEANSGESRTDASVRELKEETGLIATKVKFLFRHIGHTHKSYSGGYFKDYHTVCIIHADGFAKPKNEIKYVDYYFPNSEIRISRTTREILTRYYDLKSMLS